MEATGNHLFCQDKFDAVEILQKSVRQAENEYFGKPCGLMDQTASSVGDAVAIDFKNPATPDSKIQSHADLDRTGTCTCVSSTVVQIMRHLTG